MGALALIAGCTERAGEQRRALQEKATETADLLKGKEESKAVNTEEHAGTLAPAPEAIPSKTQVTQVQENLKSLGFYQGEIDGVWGSQTQDAIRTFQRAQGLSASGMLDPSTLDRLSEQAGKAGENW
jgi:peptidoglycan hydrolase-like protein with peptidoglycan-binding domain